MHLAITVPLQTDTHRKWYGYPPVAAVGIGPHVMVRWSSIEQMVGMFASMSADNVDLDQRMGLDYNQWDYTSLDPDFWEDRYFDEGLRTFWREGVAIIQRDLYAMLSADA